MQPSRSTRTSCNTPPTQTTRAWTGRWLDLRIHTPPNCNRTLSRNTPPLDCWRANPRGAYTAHLTGPRQSSDGAVRSPGLCDGLDKVGEPIAFGSSGFAPDNGAHSPAQIKRSGTVSQPTKSVSAKQGSIVCPLPQSSRDFASPSRQPQREHRKISDAPLP